MFSMTGRTKDCNGIKIEQNCRMRKVAMRISVHTLPVNMGRTE